MDEKIHWQNCPVCKSITISKVLQAKDFTVSNEIFEIWQCNVCMLRFTQDIPAEKFIGRYYQSQDYISHSDIKKGFINRVYHFVRNKTLRSKQKLIEQKTNLKTGSLLDVGAGTGAFANTMKIAAWTVSGIEPDLQARKNAEKNYDLKLTEMEALFQFCENSFDVITMWHVLEHVHDLHTYLETFHKILKPQGLLFISVPNYSSYDAKYYNEHWAAYDVPRHLYHFSPESIRQLAAKHDLEIMDYRPMWFDSFYISMLSEKYLHDKNNLLKALWTGSLSNLKAMRNVKKCSSVIYILKKAN